MLFGLRPRRADEELSKIYDQNAITPAVRGTTSSSLKLCIFLGYSTALVGFFWGIVMQQTTQVYCVYCHWGDYFICTPTVLAHLSRSYQTLHQLLIYDPSPSIIPFSVIIGKLTH
jgi:hypothetical protein